MDKSADPVNAAHIGLLPAEAPPDHGLFGRIQRTWRTVFRPVRIRGQYSSSVESDRPVIVEEGAILAGNIVAPRITVFGIVYGFLVAREVIVKEHGQVWGDVYAHSLLVNEEGIIHGWASTPDEATLIALAAGRTPPSPNQPELPAGLLPSGADQKGDRPAATARLIMLQQMQAEVSAALVARAELEHTFEQRLDEVAGAAFAGLQTSEAQLETGRQELAAALAKLTSIQQALDERNQQVFHYQERLAESQKTQAEQTALILTMQNSLERKSGDLEAVQQAAHSLEEQLDEAELRIEGYISHVEDLEAAFQDSLQQVSDQDEALLRWQELAEVTQLRVKELQTDLKAQARLEQLSTTLAGIEEQLATEERTSSQLREELSGQKSALKTANESLDRLELALEERDQAANQLQEQVSIQETQIEKWKSTVGKLSELLYAAESRTKELETRLVEQESAGREADEALQDQIRRQRMQLDAMGKEVNDFENELRRQGKRLAHAQAELVEKQIALDNKQAALNEGNAEYVRLEKAAVKKIQKLQAELADTKRQLNDLSARAERRR